MPFFFYFLLFSFVFSHFFTLTKTFFKILIFSSIVFSHIAQFIVVFFINIDRMYKYLLQFDTISAIIKLRKRLSCFKGGCFMKKKLISALLCASMVACMVAGCGDSGNSDKGGTEGSTG